MSPVTAIVPYRGSASFQLPPRRDDGTDVDAARPRRTPSQFNDGPASTTLARTQRRPSAAFLAHLIAASRNLPQARERRRAEPHEAIAAYAATAVLRVGIAA